MNILSNSGVSLRHIFSIDMKRVFTVNTNQIDQIDSFKYQNFTEIFPRMSDVTSETST